MKDAPETLQFPWVQLGPSGGLGGQAFDAHPPTRRGPWKINTLQGRSGSRINQLELIWKDDAGETQSSQEYGGDGGDPWTFNIQSDDYLTEIKGFIGDHNSVRVFSLQFVTRNGVESEVFGKATSSSKPFSYQCPDGYQIVGIFGRAGAEIDALGVYIRA